LALFCVRGQLRLAAHTRGSRMRESRTRNRSLEINWGRFLAFPSKPGECPEQTRRCRPGGIVLFLVWFVHLPFLRTGDAP